MPHTRPGDASASGGTSEDVLQAHRLGVAVQAGTAVVIPEGLRWQAMAVADLDKVMAIEQISHSHPWTPGNFRDSLQTTGFYLPMLMHAEQVLGYLVVMAGFEEAHLLNITVHPAQRGQGLGRLLMHMLEVWAVQQGAQQVWLEVRESNVDAQALYRKVGYEQVAIRQNYYPLTASQKEHAIVMCKKMDPVAL